MKVLVAGATGETGRRIVQVLLDQQIPVRAMVRNLEKAQKILPENVEMVVADIQKKETLSEAIDDCDYIISAAASRPPNFLGPFQIDYVATKHLIDVAKQKSIKQFVLVTSLCVSKFFHPLNLFGLILFWKKQTEEYLIDSSLNYSIIRPGGLSNEPKANASVVISGADKLFEGRIARQLVAEICVAALDNPNASKQIIEAVTDKNKSKKPYSELFEAIT